MSERTDPMPWLKSLIVALVTVESGGDCGAVGDGGRSFGCLQIQKAVVEDVNRTYGTDYVHSDAFDAIKAARICELYLRYWAGRHPHPTPETAARIWNGGPRGYLKPQTEAYWSRVKAVYQPG